MTDVLVLGGAGVDTIVRVPELPLPFADSYPVDTGVHTRAGQTGDFVALGLAALGLDVHHLDLIGDDPEGDLVRALHRDHGIALTALPQPAGTKRAVNLVGPDGRRLSLYDTSRARPGDRFPDDVLRPLAAAARHVHVTITQPCAEALPLLRETGVPLSTDLHDWDGENPYHEPYALAADVVFLSAAALTDPERTMRRISERGRARVVVATAGAEGAHLLADGELTHVPPATPAASGITRIERVLTDNAWPYRKSFAWRQALADLGAAGKRTRAYRPQTNGEVERLNRTLLDEWAYLRPYTSNQERTAAPADFLHTYNHHRSHTAPGGNPIQPCQQPCESIHLAAQGGRPGGAAEPRGRRRSAGKARPATRHPAKDR